MWRSILLLARTCIVRYNLCASHSRVFLSRILVTVRLIQAQYSTISVNVYASVILNALLNAGFFYIRYGCHMRVKSHSKLSSLLFERNKKKKKREKIPHIQIRNLICNQLESSLCQTLNDRQPQNCMWVCVFLSNISEYNTPISRYWHWIFFFENAKSKQSTTMAAVSKTQSRMTNKPLSVKSALLFTHKYEFHAAIVKKCVFFFISHSLSIISNELWLMVFACWEREREKKTQPYFPKCWNVSFSWTKVSIIWKKPAAEIKCDTNRNATIN